MLTYRDKYSELRDTNDCFSFIRSLSLDKITELFRMTSYKTNDLNNPNNPNNQNQVFKYIAKGGQGVVYLLNNNQCRSIVIKISKMDKKNNEIYFISETSKLIKNFVCPSFLLVHGFHRIKPFEIIVSELANGTLEEWLKIKRTDDEWYVMLFQIVAAVFVMQTHMKTFHSDMKPKNIFYKKTKMVGYTYNVNSKPMTFYTDMLFMVSDFGHAQSLLLKSNKLPNASIEMFIEQNKDLDELINLNKRIYVSTMIKKYTLDELTTLAKKNGDTNIISYVNNEIKNTEDKMKSYPPGIKKLMVLKSVCYYILEKKYPLSISFIEGKSMIPPSQTIVNFIDEWKNKTIVEILEQFFTVPILTNKIITSVEFTL